ncbi:TPA: hypothetical protein NG682_001004 [Vibrio parahaemolyticus]|nr:hypothetical protein [Vibrio parahaemolyticus]
MYETLSTIVDAGTPLLIAFAHIVLLFTITQFFITRINATCNQFIESLNVKKLTFDEEKQQVLIDVKELDENQRNYLLENIELMLNESDQVNTIENE